jgi:hypothetical protein
MQQSVETASVTRELTRSRSLCAKRAHFREWSKHVFSNVSKSSTIAAQEFETERKMCRYMAFRLNELTGQLLRGMFRQVLRFFFNFFLGRSLRGMFRQVLRMFAICEFSMAYSRMTSNFRS